MHGLTQMNISKIRVNRQLSNLDCYWVGSLDFNFLVEIKLGFPLNPPNKLNFLQGGPCSNQDTS